MILRSLCLLSGFAALLSAAEPDPLNSLDPSSQVGRQAFINLATASQRGDNEAADPPDSTALGGKAPSLCAFAYERSLALVDDVDVASRALVRLAERLRDSAFYDEALTVVRRIPGYRRYLAALDLALVMDLSDLPDGRKRATAIVEEMVANPTLAMTYRESGEVSIRRAQWASRLRDGAETSRISSELRGYPTLEYLAQAEARMGIEKARRGEPYDFDALVSEEVHEALLGRSVPDFNSGIGKAQFEIALIEYDRAPEGERLARTEAHFRSAMATAASSKVFVGDVLVFACEELTRRGEKALAREIFQTHAPQITTLSNAIAAKPLLLARLAPLYCEWAEGFDADRLLAEALDLAANQHPVNRSLSLTALGGAWCSMHEKERADSLWSQALDQVGRIPARRARDHAMAEFAIEVSRHVPDWPSALRGRVTEIMELP